MIETDFYKFQQDLADRLLSDPYLADVPVLVQAEGVLESEVYEQLAELNSRTGKVGAVIVVMQLSAGSANSEAPGPQLQVTATIRCIETPLYSQAAGGVGLSADAIAFRSLRLLHQWRSDVADAMLYAPASPLQPTPNLPDGTLGLDVTLRFDAGFDGARVAQPRISAEGGNISMVCHEPLAAIWYTTDGSYPRPESEEATLYSAPFSAPAPGTVVRAGAYNDNIIPSNITTLTL